MITWEEYKLKYISECEDHLEVWVYDINSAGTYQLRSQCQSCGYSNRKIHKQSELNDFKIKAKLGQLPEYSSMRSDSVYNTYYDYISIIHENERSHKKNLWFSEHNEYLNSEEWKRKRIKILERDKHLCQGCLSRQATEVHHITYKNWKKEFAFELLSLCSPCHKRYHEND